MTFCSTAEIDKDYLNTYMLYARSGSKFDQTCMYFHDKNLLNKLKQLSDDKVDDIASVEVCDSCVDELLAEYKIYYIESDFGLSFIEEIPKYRTIRRFANVIKYTNENKDYLLNIINKKYGCFYNVYVNDNDTIIIQLNEEPHEINVNEMILYLEIHKNEYFILYSSFIFFESLNELHFKNRFCL